MKSWPKNLVLFGGIILSSWVFSAGRFDGTFFHNNSSSSSSWWRNGSTLDCDFVNDRYYLNGTTYSGINSFITAAGGTFDRNTTATYYDSAGVIQTASANTIRLERDPKTKAGKGILIEEPRINYFLNSSNLTLSPWVKTSSVTITNTAMTAPDGTGTVSLVSADGSSNGYFNQSGLPSTANTTVTRSYFVKANSTSKIYLEFTDSTNCAIYCIANFDLAAGTGVWSSVKTGQGAVTIIPLDSGWYRISATFSYSAAGSSVSPTYVAAYGSGVGSLYVWGAQFEIGPSVTSYIPTAGSSASRARDNFYFPVGTWYNANTGTFVTESYVDKNSGQTFYSRVIGTSSTGSIVGYGVNFSTGSTFNGTTALTQPATVTGSPTQYTKMAFAWDQTTSTQSFAMSRAQLKTQSYSGNWSTTNVYPGGSLYNPINACLRRMTFFPVRMHDTYLQNATQ